MWPNATTHVMSDTFKSRWVVWSSKGWVDIGIGNWHQIVSSSRKYKDHRLKDSPVITHITSSIWSDVFEHVATASCRLASSGPTWRDVTWPRRWCRRPARETTLKRTDLGFDALRIAVSLGLILIRGQWTKFGLQCLVKKSICDTHKNSVWKS